jgi:Ca2+-transporting ATPase
MGPTCSIIYENEPMETNLMLQKPRPLSNTFFNWKEILMSIIQGLVITGGLLLIYQFCVQNHSSEDQTRTVIFLTLIVANIFMTLVNRSFYYSIFTTIRYKNNLVPMIIGITIGITLLLLWIPMFSKFFRFEMITTTQLIVSVGVGMVSVLWIEIYKWMRRR